MSDFKQTLILMKVDVPTFTDNLCSPEASAAFLALLE